MNNSSADQNNPIGTAEIQSPINEELRITEDGQTRQFEDSVLEILDK